MAGTHHTQNMNLSPTQRRAVALAVMTLLVAPMVLFGLLVLFVFGEGVGAMLSMVAGLTLATSGALSWMCSGRGRRVAREVFSGVCALLAGLAAFAGFLFMGVGVGAVGFMGSTPSHEDDWMLLCVLAGVLATPLVWWLVRRELTTGTASI